tara:strand:- start:479 stop:727 length:249 start_codon:yes stop_codon:yes gene_type:complete
MVELSTTVYVVPLITSVSPTVELAHLHVPPSKAMLLAVVPPEVVPPVVVPPVLVTTGALTVTAMFCVISLQPPLLTVVIVPL